MFGISSFSAAPFSDLGESALVVGGVVGTGAVGSATVTGIAIVSVTGGFCYRKHRWCSN